MISDDARRPRTAPVSRDHDARRRCPRERPDRPPLRPPPAALRAPWSGSRRTGPCSTPTTLKDNPENRRPLIEEQTVKRGTIKTADGVTIAESHPGGRRHAPGLRPRLPAGLAVRQPGRLQLRRPRPDRDRALRERRAGRRAERVHVDPRPAPRRARRRATTSPSRSTRNAQRVATQALQSAIASTAGRERLRRRGRRARPLHRRGQGDGLGARLRPELARGPQGLASS